MKRLWIYFVTIAIFLATTVVCQSAVVTTGIPVSQLPTTNSSPDSAWLIVNQNYVGRLTNDTFKIALSNLFQPRIDALTNFDTVIVTNLTITSNFTFQTTIITNINQSTGDTLWTNMGAYIAPIAFVDRTQISTNGQLRLGAGGPDVSNLLWPGIYSFSTPGQGLAELLVGIQDPANTNSIIFGFNTYGDSSIAGDWDTIQYTTNTFFQIHNGTSDNYVSSDIGGTNYMKLWPTVPATNNAIAYNFNALNPLSGVVEGTLMLGQVQDTTQFRIKAPSGYTGIGDLYLSDDGTYKAAGGGGGITNIFQTIIVTNLTVITNITIGGTNVPTINPTDNYLPVRYNTNTFIDSPWYTVGGTNVGTDRWIVLGPGDTNVVFRNGSDIVITNGATQVELEIRNGTGRSAFVGISSAGNVELRSANGATAVWLNNGTDAVVLFSGGFIPSSSTDLGSTANKWKDVYLKTNSIVFFGTNQLTSSDTNLFWNGVQINP